MGSHRKILRRTGSALRCGEISLLLIECFEGRVSGLEVMGQGYFNITSKTQKGQTQVSMWGGG